MNHRITKRTALVAALIAPVVVLGGVAAADPAPAGHASVVSQSKRGLSTDARTVFLGAMFGQGPIAKVVYDKLPSSTPDVVAAAEELTTKVEAAYPGTLQSVYDAIATGSPAAVTTAMDTAAGRLKSLAGNGEGAERLISPDCVLLLVAVAAAGAIWIFWVVPAAAMTENTRLERDKAALNLATLVS
ncbi:hypothetical protein [Lentzea sp. NPDC051838]|uniref:hypothetical protein n=1 Tax=Lentzea sp. NPDC051838 TaxID=3154849 RepID=UPI00341DA1C3